MSSNYRRLKVYGAACRLSDEVREQVLAWDSFDRWTLGVQLVRAADSIGANIAEAYGRERAADQRRFLYIARGSTLEVAHWLHRASSRGLTVARAGGVEDIARMLNGLLAKHRSARLRTAN
jgi:four helix bundle protein